MFYGTILFTDVLYVLFAQFADSYISWSHHCLSFDFCVGAHLLFLQSMPPLHSLSQQVSS